MGKIIARVIRPFRGDDGPLEPGQDYDVAGWLNWQALARLGYIRIVGVETEAPHLLAAVDDLARDGVMTGPLPVAQPPAVSAPEPEPEAQPEPEPEPVAVAVSPRRGRGGIPVVGGA